MIGDRLTHGERDPMRCVAGFAVAVDLTERKLQRALQEKKLPWVLAKGFDTSCPIGEFIPKCVLLEYLS